MFTFHVGAERPNDYKASVSRSNLSGNNGNNSPELFCYSA